MNQQPNNMYGSTAACSVNVPSTSSLPHQQTSSGAVPNVYYMPQLPTDAYGQQIIQYGESFGQDQIYPSKDMYASPNNFARLPNAAYSYSNAIPPGQNDFAPQFQPPPLANQNNSTAAQLIQQPQQAQQFGAGQQHPAMQNLMHQPPPKTANYQKRGPEQQQTYPVNSYANNSVPAFNSPTGPVSYSMTQPQQKTQNPHPQNNGNGNANGHEQLNSRVYDNLADNYTASWVSTTSSIPPDQKIPPEGHGSPTNFEFTSWNAELVPKSFSQRLDAVKDEPILHPDSPKWYNRELNEKTRDALAWAAPYDARFPQIRKQRQCFAYYVDFFRCKELMGEDYKPCQFFQNVYRDFCPKFWVEAKINDGSAQNAISGNNQQVPGMQQQIQPTHAYAGQPVPQMAYYASNQPQFAPPNGMGYYPMQVPTPYLSFPPQYVMPNTIPAAIPNYAVPTNFGHQQFVSPALVLHQPPLNPLWALDAKPLDNNQDSRFENTWLDQNKCTQQELDIQRELIPYALDHNQRQFNAGHSGNRNGLLSSITQQQSLNGGNESGYGDRSSGASSVHRKPFNPKRGGPGGGNNRNSGLNNINPR